MLVAMEVYNVSAMLYFVLHIHGHGANPWLAGGIVWEGGLPLIALRLLSPWALIPRSSVKGDEVVSALGLNGYIP